jgi:hypothetical protein
LQSIGRNGEFRRAARSGDLRPSAAAGLDGSGEPSYSVPRSIPPLPPAFGPEQSASVSRFLQNSFDPLARPCVRAKIPISCMSRLSRRLRFAQHLDKTRLTLVTILTSVPSRATHLCVAKRQMRICANGRPMVQIKKCHHGRVWGGDGNIIDVL